MILFFPSEYNYMAFIAAEWLIAPLCAGMLEIKYTLQYCSSELRAPKTA